ncbi:sensory transduction histidine kinase [Methanosarcina siciliae T4/M]|uniref:histidine kinase n=2 Tax=Methanosarcina siciliae TaxID=38027 RepID=A0A0E3PBP9_9EURY|nr:PAS domain S-box protein [Methanosarcina siciliae]AKB27682.1 sensory transduction histidine kinase [Methanosarcina siciliae T4/M]AKB31619.1 sensory transduction histidine kinase [Methanosarcina siciliae HI350]
MEEKMRMSGIDIIGNIPWGTHFCQFYQTKEDLMDVLVPYFKTGLENNEFCMWITSQPLDVKDAKEALRKAVPDFDVYLEKGQIEIIPYTHWYVQEGYFDSEKVLNGWIEKLKKALANGYEGLRLSGNTFWLEKKDWNDFVQYEKEIDNIIGNYQMIALCTYCLEKCNSTEIVDVVINHQFALIKREGKWEQIESSKRKRAEETALQAAKDWKHTFDAVPDLIAIIDTEYRVVRANRAMAAKLGVTPEECVGLTCYQAVHGTDSPPFFCPHKQLLKDGMEHTTEICEDCLGGCFLVSVSPLYDSKENLIGSVHVARDITESKQAVEALYEAYENLRVKSEELQAQAEEIQMQNEELQAQTEEIQTQNEELQAQAEELNEAYCLLCKSEERFRTLAENSPDIVARFDRLNRHLYVNPAAAEPYGRSPEEIIGKTNRELGMDPELVKLWESHYQTVFASGKTEKMDFHYISPPGKEYYFSTRIVPEFVNDDITSVLAISRDITDIKKAEIGLKEARDNLKKLVEKRTLKLRKAYELLEESEKGLAEAQKMSHLGNWNWNIESNELYWSDEIYRIFGCRPQEFGATYDSFLSYVHPEDRVLVDETVKEAFNGKIYSIDHRIFRADGRERIVHEQGEVIFDRENVPVQMKGTVQDVTERKLAEKALELASKYNRSLIEASLDPLVTIGTDGKITDVNISTETITGYSRDELIGTDFSDYFTEPEKAKESYMHVFQEGLVRDYPLEILHRDGHITHVLYNASVYRGETGEVIGVFAAARDITELKKAGEKIKTLVSAVESSDDAVITMSLDGMITSWNIGAEKVYGYSAEEILGKKMSVLEPANLEGEIKQLIERIKQGEGINHYETVRLKKDSTLVDISVALSPVFDDSGKIMALSAIARNITERKKAEEALRLSNIYNRSLLEASLDPLVTIGPDGKITDVNKATEQITGYSRSELIGTDFTNYFTEPEKAEEGYQQVFRKGSVLDYALEIQHRNGSVTPVLYNASIYRDESGKVIGVFAAARDITELKKAEEILELKLEELARSNADLEQFAYVSSHDLQEPLRMIASYLQLLQRRYQGELDERADKYIYFAVDGASRMQSLINDLLEFSRVTTKARELEPTDCESILKYVLSDLEFSIKENEATVSYDSLPEIMADGTQLTQVFQNLISNAIKFRSKETPKIHVSAENEGDKWRFSVQDNGIGIDPKYAEKIFELFKRLHKREDYPGTGIGLSICKKIIERHGGDIWVESEPGRGSTFYFTLSASFEKLH